MIQSQPSSGESRAGIVDFALQGANQESLSPGFVSLVDFDET
jgi:hypothetical protein